jgi:hypothetical protein
MAILHVATLSPTKSEIIAAWLPDRPWSPDSDEAVELVGAYRFDDPEGRVGLEVHLVRLSGVLLQVPLTYRDAALDGADEHLVSTMQHSVLGPRWVYDGLHDPILIGMLAAATMTGCGQAVGVVERDGRRAVVPPSVRLHGGGWSQGPAAVDGFSLLSEDVDWCVLSNDRVELRVARRPVEGDRPEIGLSGLWPGQDKPVVLTEVRAHDGEERPGPQK